MSDLKLKFFAIVSVVALVGAVGCGGSNIETDDGNPNDTVLTDEGGIDTNVPEDTNGTDTNVPEDTNLPEDTNGTDTNVPEDTTIPEDTNGTDTNVPEDTNIPEDTNVPEDTNGTDTNGTDTNVPEDVSVPECPVGQSIADLIALTEGTVDMTLCGAMVTKVTEKGWYIADDSTEHGMYIYEGTNPDWGYEVAVGDYITMHVTTYGNYQNSQQITGKDTVTVIGSGDAAQYTIDLSAGTLPDESMESRVVKIDAVKVTSANGKAGTIDYGTATNVLVYVDYANIPCVGLTADIVSGVVVQYNSAFQIKVTDDTDLINANVDNCETEPEYNMGNWDFEKVDVEVDPPEGFKKGTGNTYTCTRTSTGGADGTAGITMTWTDTANQDLIQGYMFPAAADDTVMFSLDVLDNDAAGKARLGLAFYDSAKAFLSSQWSNEYTVDSPNWQTLGFDYVAPANTAFVTGTFRMYDDAGWAAAGNTATVTIDNWEMITVAP